MKELNLKKGNCLIYSLLFYFKNPNSKIRVIWNKSRNIPTFYIVLNEEQYFYKPKVKMKKYKFIFEGQVIKVKNLI